MAKNKNNKGNNNNNNAYNAEFAEEVAKTNTNENQQTNNKRG